MILYLFLGCSFSIDITIYKSEEDDNTITPTESEDMDSDGMPDWYEYKYQGEVMFEDHFEDGTLDPAWVMKRMYWEEADGKLKSLPQVLPGFNYGHSGNGRSAAIVLHEGDTNWRDYSYEFVYCPVGVSSKFNPHSLPIGFYRTLNSTFRTVEQPASWNEPMSTYYAIVIGIGDGMEENWRISAIHESYIPGTGWKANYEGEKITFIDKNSSDINTGIQTNHVRVLVKDNHIYTWVNGAFLGECEDSLNRAPYGGISFSGGLWESMGWFDDVIVRKLGLDPNIPDAHLDYDQDGFTNQEEFQNGTNPFVFNES